MIYSPETKTRCQTQLGNHNYINYMISHLVKKKPAHSVRADPFSSRPNCPAFLILAHVVPALAEH
jgi:hypothetical protein